VDIDRMDARSRKFKKPADIGKGDEMPGEPHYMGTEIFALV
jgi:hypothetical protein